MAQVAVLGNAIIDEFLKVPCLPGRGGDVLAEEAGSYVGGCGANVAVTLSRLGVPVTLLGRLGDDARGRRVKAYLEGEGVDTRQLTLAPGGTTTYCLTLVEPDGERTFITVLGREGPFPLSLSAGDFRSWSVLFVSGYSLVGPGQGASTLGLLRETRKRGIPIVFDPGPLARESAAETLAEAVELSTAVLTGEGELDLPDGAGLSPGPEVVVVKRGAEGAQVYCRGKDPFTVPACAIRPVDTTGAGDAFAAGFIYGFVHSWPVERSVRFAAACGAAAALVEGPVGVEGLDQVEQLIMQGEGGSNNHGQV